MEVFIYGFGYDLFSNEYGVFVRVLSMKANTWRKIPYYDAISYICPRRLDGCFVNGAIHWLGSLPDLSYVQMANVPSAIVALDSAKESFYFILLPIIDGLLCLKFIDLSIIDGLLCLIRSQYEGYSCLSCCQSQFWIMREHAVWLSWFRLAKIETCNELDDHCKLGDPVLTKI